MAEPPSPTTAIINDFKSLPAIQTSFQAYERPRPPMMNPAHRDMELGARIPLAPLSPPQLPEQQRAGGLFGFFGRSPKAARRSKSHGRAPPNNLRFDPAPLQSPRTASPSRSARAAKPSPKISPHLTLDRSAVSPGGAVNRMPSRMSLKPKEPKPAKAPKTKPPKAPRPSAVWAPPPLFQAYPQAIKHSILEAPTLSIETILRMHASRNETDAMHDVLHGMPDLDDPDADSIPVRDERGRSRHRRKTSGSFSRSDWTHKIYVLVTLGYLLQYSAEGAFDRLPEKILQLDKDSVAFASDAMPGKHWVLQISRLADGDESVVPEVSRSRFAKLPFWGANARRFTGNMLLVLDRAEEMDAWMSAVRKEIEVLGGKKHEPSADVSRSAAERRNDAQLRASTQRYSIIRNPSQFSHPGPFPEPLTPVASPPGEDAPREGHVSPILEDFHEEAQDDAYGIAKRHSTTRPLTGTPSTTATTISDDQTHLDRLRESSRLSYMSSGTWTLNTSRGTSPTCSPTDEAFTVSQSLSSDSRASSIIKARRSLGALTQRRESLQVARDPKDVPAPHKASRPPSTYALAKATTSAGPTTNGAGTRTSARYSSANAPPIPKFAASPIFGGLLTENTLSTVMHDAPPEPPSTRHVSMAPAHSQSQATTVEPVIPATEFSLDLPPSTTSIYSNARLSRSMHTLPSNALPPEPSEAPPPPPPASTTALAKIDPRPASLMVRDGVSPGPKMAAEGRPPRSPSYLPAGCSAVPVVVQGKSKATRISYRKSMPSLVPVGPPPVPPPNIPLPEVPKQALAVDGAKALRVM